MKKVSVKFFLPVTLALIAALALSSCRGRGDPAVERRLDEQRAITVVNNTGYPISNLRVTVAGSGVLVTERQLSDTHARIEIPNGLREDPRFEVVLVDRHGRSFARTFDVPLVGNTDAPVDFSDRVREGAIVDRFRDTEAWLNRNR